ncbi:MAG: ketopantoate reductase family protein [Colwellia sp.]
MENNFSENNKRFVIVGQGAIGLLWYHHLKRLSDKCNSLHVSLQTSKNADLTATTYFFTPFNPSVSKEEDRLTGKINYASEAILEQADVVIFCLKAYQMSEAIEGLASQLKSGTTLILAHNGMGTLSKLSSNVLDKFNIATMLTTHGCLRYQPNAIRHTGLGKSSLGINVFSKIAANKQASLFDLKQSIATLNQALPIVEYVENIANAQWLKLAINCVINPITALNDIDNGEVLNKEYDTLKEQLIYEIVNVASAEEITLRKQFLINTVNNVAKATAKNSSSMRCDIQENRKTEIDYINGYIHELGLKHNIETPANTEVWRSVLALENGIFTAKARSYKSELLRCLLLS